MSASLDQSSLDPASGSLVSADRRCDPDDFSQYRSLSAAAVVALLFGVLSIVAMLPDYWMPKAVPVVGILLAGSAMLRIRSHSDELSGMRPATIGLGLSAFFLVAGSAFTVYSEMAMVPDGYTPISYEQLKPTADRPFSPPEGARLLDGQRVFIRGYMLDTAQASGITQFILCRDKGDCCFGGDPPISDMIFVKLKDPQQARYTVQVRHLAGTFRVAGMRHDGVRNPSLYVLEADYIK